MNGFEYSLTFLIIYLVILVIYKLIFWLCEHSSSDDEKKKEVKVKTIEIEGSGSVDNYDDGVNKNKESVSTYLVKDKKNKSSANFNSDEYLGNYMHDVLVIDAPIPHDAKYIFSDEQSNQKIKQVDQEDIVRSVVNDDFLPIDNHQEKFDVAINAEVEEKMDSLFTSLVDSKTENKKIVNEYKGLSKELKMFLIAKILDRKISM